ncbi:phosphotransferase [uncultured Roseovarius sp.]|uniref:aminoglycoside phosphotransferase family protein n=1 Tax=uncultured Roseovarius sp. TaxID=293344 RepID=UPI002637B64F|nr:phosphotransferase [uncultured Roseovarius sp.]
MTDRPSLARAFLLEAKWADAQMKLLAGDASNRKYHRLTSPETGETAVLMDAPPAKGEDVRPFVYIAKYLSSIGLSAPRILAEDNAQGFLLIEDLGDALFTRVAADHPTLEKTLYTAATDALIDLHKHAPPLDLESYDSALMSDMAILSFDWYAAAVEQPTIEARHDFHTAICDVLTDHVADGSVLIQRDYHAENLLWLPDRVGIARVGLLDFQDAMLGHRAYDLVSLLQDARRDVPHEIEREMINRYVAATNVIPEDFESAYRCLGAQRNLRILGVFTRLCIRDGKSSYIDLIPRVWEHLRHDLAHPALTKVAEIIKTKLPEPMPQTLQILKDKCATVPTQ